MKFLKYLCLAVATIILLFFLFSEQDETETICGTITAKHEEVEPVGERGNFKVKHLLLLDNSVLENVGLTIYLKYNVGQHICLIHDKGHLVWSWNKVPAINK